MTTTTERAALPALEELTEAERDAARVLVGCMREGVDYDYGENGHLTHVITHHGKLAPDGYVASWSGHTAREAWDAAVAVDFGRNWPKPEKCEACGKTRD